MMISFSLSIIVFIVEGETERNLSVLISGSEVELSFAEFDVARHEVRWKKIFFASLILNLIDSQIKILGKQQLRTLLEHRFRYRNCFYFPRRKHGKHLNIRRF